MAAHPLTEACQAYMTKDDAAEYARVAKRTIERAVAAGELEAVGGRGLIRIRPEWVDDWLIRRGPANR